MDSRSQIFNDENLLSLRNASFCNARIEQSVWGSVYDSSMSVLSIQQGIKEENTNIFHPLDFYKRIFKGRDDEYRSLEEFQELNRSLRTKLPYTKIEKATITEHNPFTSRESSQKTFASAKESSSTEDLTRNDDQFFNALKSQDKRFVASVKLTDFEDGIVNDVIKEVRGYESSSQFVTYSWLNTLYTDHQRDDIFLAGLLRIVGMLCGEHSTEILMPMVIAGLSYRSSSTQEAALMVIEKWRNKACLEALRNHNIVYSSTWIKKYAESIKSELEDELVSC